MSTWFNYDYWFPPSGGTHTYSTVKIEERLFESLRTINPLVAGPLSIAFPNMALVKEESTEKPSKTLIVSFRGEQKILRVLNNAEVKTQVTLNRNQVGLEWEVFRHDRSLVGAVAYNKYHRRMVYLNQERVLNALKHPKRNDLVLCGTLSSAQEVSYHHPFFTEDSIGGFLKTYLYSPLRNSLLFSLALHYKGFKIDHHLGTGSFNTVWAFSYIGKDGKPTQSVLRVPRRLLPSRGKESKTRSMDQYHFGGEFAQYVPNDPTIVRFEDALVINEREQFEFLNRDQIREYFHDRSSVGDRNFLLMASVGEYLPDAVPLDDYLKTHVLSEEVIVSATRQLLLALAELHELKIMHRDLKTGNILVVEKGEALFFKLFDFGFAFVASNSPDLSQSTLMEDLASTRLGTPMTLAPELFQRGNYGFAADLYGAGCILYELIFSKPFRGQCRTMRDVAKHAHKDHTEALTADMDTKQIHTRFPNHREALKGLLIALLSQEMGERPTPLKALDPFIHDPPSKPVNSWKFHHLLFLGGAIFIAYLIGKRIFERMQLPIKEAPIIYRFQK